ncbi:MAG: recombinase A [Polyangiaceae bacterium]
MKALGQVLDPRGLMSRVGYASQESVENGEARAKTLPLGLASPARLDELLPDGGLPCGAVVELTTPRSLGRATSVALAACASAQELARARAVDSQTAGAWCAFVDPWRTLHTPAVLRARVDPTRLLVVRPSIEALARSVIRIAESRVFAVIVVDTSAPPGASNLGTVRLDRWSTVVRRLAIALEGTDTTLIVLTDATAPRSIHLPVAMRLDLARVGDSLVGDRWVARISKERFGRVSGRLAIGAERDVGALDVARA